MFFKKSLGVMVSLLSIAHIACVTENEYSHIISKAMPPAEVIVQVDRLFQDPRFIEAFIQRENSMSNAQRRAIAQEYDLKKSPAGIMYLKLLWCPDIF